MEITLAFQYAEELKLFLQLFLLGMVLGTIVMYITEAVKKWLKGCGFFARNTWAISLVCFFVSMIFGIGWKMTFAADTIGWYGAAWLGLLLFLGSTGLYSKLEESDGFWGKTVQSYHKYADSGKLVEQILKSASNTTDNADNAEKDESVGED